MIKINYMKKALLIIVTLFLLNVYGISQSIESKSKIDIELLTEMSNSKDDAELFHVIVVMSEQYDQVAMEQKTKFMNKKTRREFVVNEMKRFTGELQADVVRVMNEGVRSNSVKDFKQFWVFNGFSCKAAKAAIELIASREDVAMVYSDKERNMLPEEWNPQPAGNVKGNAWNVTKVNADDVWSFYGDTGYTGDGVVVALIDSGLNYNHTDIVNSLWDGGADYPKHGWDFVNDDNDPMDDNGHGTHCGGTIAGCGTNGTQTGMAPGAKLMVLKTQDQKGSGSFDDMAEAIQFALEHGADVLSMSVGAPGIGGYWFMRDIMVTVLNAGIAASVAAGNEGDELGKYPIPTNIGVPGNCPPPYLHPDQKNILAGGTSAVICVGATDQNDVHTYFTSVGPTDWGYGGYVGSYQDYPYTAGSATEIGLIRPDVAAPGYQITSLYYGNNTGYCNMNGTSMATPCNAGVIALMLEANPLLTPREIDSILEHTAVRCEGSTSKSNYTGSGRIDAYAAVSAALGGCDAPTNLTASISNNEVTLTWDTVEDIATYSVYRNNVLIYNSVATTSFTDYLPAYGCYFYYVKSNCPYGGNSMASNLVDVNYVYPGPVVTNLTGDVDADNVTLQWEEPLSESAEMYYGIVESSYYTADYKHWAQKYEPSKLNQCAGMAVSEVRFVSPAAGTYLLEIYNGTTVSPTTLIASKSVSANASQWTEIVLDEPSYVNYLEPLWITLHTEASSAIAMVEYVNDDYTNAILLSNDEGATYFTPNWSGGYRFSASIIVEMTDGEYSYNIYKDGAEIAENRSGSSYNYTENDNGFHEYHVTTNYLGGESQPSNSVCVPAGATKQFLGNNSTQWTTADNWKNNSMPSSTDNVWVRNDVIVDANADINSMYINKAVTATVNAGKTLNVSNDIESLSENGWLTVESGGAFVSGAAGVKGTVKRQFAVDSKDRVAGKWHFLSSPVAAAPVSDFINSADGQNYDLYVYDEPSFTWLNEKDDNHDVDNLFYTENGMNFNPGRGYLVSYGTTTEMSFNGVFNSGEVAIPVTASSSVLKGFNLIGNPYPCSIDWDAEKGWTRDVLGDNPYIWIYNDDVHQYGVYQLGQPGGTNGVSNIIASCQGFFVKADSNGNLTLNDNVKTTESGAFRKGNDSKSISIRVSGKNGSDEVMICKTDKKLNNAEKLYSRNETVPSLYLEIDGEKYSIVNVEENETSVIRLGFECGTTGKFTISSCSDVELVDNLTGIVTNLSSNSYEFVGSNADDYDRFLVRIPNGSCDDEFVYQNGEELIIDGNGQVLVFDCLGRVVVDDFVNNGKIDVSSLNTGVYVVKMNDRYQKIVIR